MKIDFIAGLLAKAVEIRALMDPTAVMLPSDIAVRVYVRGDGAPGVTVIATHEPSGASRSSAADARGIANVRLDRPGAWRVEFHSLEPAEDDDADWVLHSGTLTFDAGAGGAR